MKILLIAYSFPPLWEAQAIRWYYLSRELGKLGFSIDIVTVKHPAYFDIELHENISIHRVFPGPFEAASFKVREALKVDKKAELRRKKSFYLARKIYRCLRGVFNNFLPGDIRTEWFPFIIKFVSKNFNLRNYDFLITSHEPYVDSLVGLNLKNKYPSLKWIADISDPFTAPYYPAWRKRIDQRFEEKVIMRADKILVTSETLRREYLIRYGIEENKIILIRQGFDFVDERVNKNKNEIFTIVYTGIFYKKRRDPENLFAALKELDFDFKFTIAGRNEEFLPKDNSLKDKIVFLGFVDHPEVLKIQKEADLLIHITYYIPSQVPGKFYEYLGSRKPVLCIANNKEDETVRLTRELNIGLVCENKKDSIRAALIRLHELWKRNEISQHFNLNPSNFKEYSWQHHAKVLAENLWKMK